MSSFQISGKLTKIYPVETKGNNFQTQEFVLETQERYPQFVKFQLTQEMCGTIDKYNEGDQLNVSFNIRGREWQGKYFNNLSARKIENSATSTPAGQSMLAEENLNQISPDDDLPF